MCRYPIKHHVYQKDYDQNHSICACEINEYLENYAYKKVKLVIQ